MPLRFNCAQGHVWEINPDDSPAADRRVACPECGFPAETMTLDDIPPVPPTGNGSHSRPSADAPTVLGGGSPSVPGYEVLDELGRGGMGVVYKARQTSLKRIVSLKMLLAVAHAGQRERKRFRAEAEAVARLQHPNIVQVHEIGEQDGCPYFSLEYVEGGSLDRRLAGTPLPAVQAGQLVETLARAVHAAHQAGIVHRDLKPANVLLVGPPETPIDQCTPKITDFGVAKRLDTETGQTRSGAILGTPSYMAPEQAAGKSREIGPAADVYSLGAIFYELLTGRPPFRGESTLDTLQQVLFAEPVAPSRLQPKLARDAETICLRCLQKEPRRRYESALALAEDLRRFRTGLPISARPVGLSERAWRWCRRNPAVAGLIAAVVLALLVGTVASGLFAVHATDSARRALDEKDRAEKSERQAQVERDFARRTVYVARLNLAQVSWRDLDVVRLTELLESERPSRDADDLRGFDWHYLWQLSHPRVRAVARHDGPVERLLFSPDGKRVASISRYERPAGRTVKLWDVETGLPVLTMRHVGRVDEPTVRFTGDGRRVLCFDSKGAVQVWDPESSREVFHATPPRAIWWAALSPDGKRVAWIEEDGLVRVWQVDPARGLAGFTPGTPVRRLEFSPDGIYLAAADDEGPVKLLEAATGHQIHVLEGHRSAVSGLAFSTDGRRLATADRVEAVKVWDVATGGELLSLRHDSSIDRLAFSRDDKRLAGFDGNKGIHLWDPDTGRELFAPRPGDPPGSVGLSRDGRRIARANGRRVRVWTVDNERHQMELDHEGVIDVAVSPDGQRLASVGADGTVRLWEVDVVRPPPVLRHRDRVIGLAFSGDGRRLEAVSADETVSAWDVRTALPIDRPRDADFDRISALSPDGRWAAALGADRPVRLYHVETRKEALALRHTNVTSVAFTPDGKRVATGDWAGAVKVWDRASGRELFTLGHGSEGRCEGLAISPDGSRVACRGTDRVVHLWELADARAILRAERAGVFAFSRDGKRLAVADTDTRSVRLWDLETGQEIRALRGHAGPILSLVFSPDDRRLASGSRGGTVRLWDAATGMQVLPLRHGSPVSALAFAPDGLLLASAGEDGTIELWDARPPPR